MSASSPFRLVATPGGAVLLDLDDGAALQWIADSLIASTQDAASQTVLSQTQLEGRYDGSRTDFEQRSNGSLSWTAYVTGATPAQLAQSIRTLIAQVESPARTFVERRDPGWTSSLFYERRGPGAWTQTMLDPMAGMATIDVALPVAPAALGTAFTTTAAITSPGVVTLPAIPGTLPALVDVQLDLPATPLAWALLAPYAVAVVANRPFGIISAPALTLTGLALAADAAASGGQSAQVAAAGAGTGYTVAFAVDPWLAELGDFEDDLAVEVWVRVRYDAASLIGASLIAGASPPGGVGASRTATDLPNGRPIGDTAAGSVWRIHRAGVLRLPQEVGSGLWTVSASITPGAGSGGLLAVDWLALVPARHRAAMPTGVTNAAGQYPRLLASSAAAQTKHLGRDGAGGIALTGGVPHQDTGIGGAPLRILPGTVGQLLTIVSPAVPDDPGTTAGGDTLTALTARVTVTPRYSLWSAP